VAQETAGATRVWRGGIAVKRVVLLIVMVLVVGGVLFRLIDDTTGSVTVSLGSYIVQFSLWTALLLLLVAILLFWLIYTGARMLLAPGWRLMANRESRRRQKLIAQYHDALLAVAEGRWEPARKSLLKTAEKLDGSSSTISYLAAAKAAAENGQLESALETLDQARASSEEGALAVDLTRARLLLDRHRPNVALEVLRRVHSAQPVHPVVLSLLCRCYRELEDWDSLEKLLPDLKRSKTLSPEDIFELQVLVRSSQLARFAQASAPAMPAQNADTKPQHGTASQMTQIEGLWGRTEKAVRAAPKVLAAYVRALSEAGAADMGEQILRRALGKSWDNDLILLYGQLESNDSLRQLVTAERWLRDRPGDPDLLLTLGRLCRRNELWGKGRDYLEASLNAANRPETCAEMAYVMAKLGEDKQSAAFFKRGLLDAVGMDENLRPELPRAASRSTTSG